MVKQVEDGEARPMTTPPSEDSKSSDTEVSSAESDQKTVESKKELWKSVPKSMLAEAIYRGDDETRADIARNVREIYQERTGKELDENEE